MEEFLLRAGLAGVFLVGIAAIVVASRAVALRARAAVLGSPPDPALATGRLCVLYFHGDRCGDCVVQERELDLLLLEHPEVGIRADHAPSELSARYRVLTVPTTVVLDGAGRPRAVNYGLALRARLEKQLRDATELESLSETA